MDQYCASSNLPGNIDCKLLIDGRIIGRNSPVFFIAEIGQNHQGNLEIAKKLIDAAKASGADCVKFQKTDINEKFTEKVLQEPYHNQNSWGATYGEHKKHLEFDEEQFQNLQEYAKSRDIMFTASAMDIKSLEFLLDVKVPFVKIGSGDANNILLLKKAAKCGKPLIISTGMLSFNSVRKIESLVSKYSEGNFAFLHCVSSYPTPLKDVNLSVIQLYQKTFPNIVIGYSGHELGIDVSVAATVIGAKIIERHLTLDKSQKGTDHKCSLLPEEFCLMIERVKQLQLAIGIPRKFCMESEMECWRKLGKTLVAARHLKRGELIREHDLKIKVAHPKGIDAIHYDDVVGKVLNTDLDEDEPLLKNYIDCQYVKMNSE